MLNVPKEASVEEIREKYKQLAGSHYKWGVTEVYSDSPCLVLLHPDKQVDESQRKLASEHFQRVQRAYQVLTDPNRRAIYDQYGESGLQFASQVAHRSKSPAEVSLSVSLVLERRLYLNSSRLSRKSKGWPNSVKLQGV